MEDVSIATFADDTALMATAATVEESMGKLQEAANRILHWCNFWRIKLNESKSVHVDFTLRNIERHRILTINNVEIARVNSAKYLGMTLDTRLRWKEHVMSMTFIG